MLAIYISPPGHQSKKEEATEKSASVTNIIMNLEKERHVATTGTAPIFSPHLKCIDGKEEKSFLLLLLQNWEIYQIYSSILLKTRFENEILTLRKFGYLSSNIKLWQFIFRLIVVLCRSVSNQQKSCLEQAKNTSIVLICIAAVNPHEF